MTTHKSARPRLALLLSAGAIFAAAATSFSPTAAAAAPAVAEKALVARWTFDDPANLGKDAGPGRYHASPSKSGTTSPSKSGTTAPSKSGTTAPSKSGTTAAAPAPVPTALATTPGVLGNAAAFSAASQQTLSAPPSALPDDLRELTFSAWIAPNSLAAHATILRKEDGETRLLFSIQSGRFLTLGINCGRNYAELDALVSADELTDGRWHLVTATFDGQVMRAYLDAREIGTFDRQVPLNTIHDYVTRRPAPFFIGSNAASDGYFDGKLDDLRFYSKALSPAEIKALYAEPGPLPPANSATADTADTPTNTPAAVSSLYKKQPTFLATIAALDVPAVRALSNTALVHLQRHLRDDFPADVNAYIYKEQKNPLDNLRLDPAARRAYAAELAPAALEYLPLTDFQWAALSRTERAQWERARQLRDLLADPAAALPATIAHEFEALIHPRPARHESVAKYVNPTTPETRDRTADEARQVIERDWLFQAGGKPTFARALEEITYTRALLARLNLPAPDTAAYTTKLDDLAATAEAAQAQIAAAQAATAEAAAPEAQASAVLPVHGKKSADAAADAHAPTSLYYAIRTLKREITFKNPALDFDSILYIDNPNPSGREWNHETRHRLGYQAVPGGRLLVQKGLSPDGKLTQLLPRAPLHGSFWRPDLSYDATKILVSYKPHNEKTFHLYEIGLDGTGFRQLTGGMFDDFDPIYLPDQQNILFTTTRGYLYVRCMPPTNAMVTARMALAAKPGDKTIYITSRNGEPEYTPSVLTNGRIIYTRWEYTDKPLWRAQSLWTMNQDTTDVQTYWGNQSVWPDLLKDARSIPGSNRVMFTGSAHHNWFAGSIGIIDPAKGLNFPHGLTKVTQDLPWPESGNGPTDPKENTTYHTAGKYTAYYSPYPLNEKDFLVSAKRGNTFVLLLMDTDGNREIINEGTHNIWDAQPIRKRPIPKATPDRVEWPTWETRDKPATGILYSSNVAEGVPALKGKAKFLRIWSIEHKTYTYWFKRPTISTGPEISINQSEGVKRILGTVPIEDDGSVYFNAPTGIALHFQLLDKDQRALQTMKSFTGVQPGEIRGCVGCHEKQMNAPAASLAATSKAIARGRPSDITPVPWEDNSVSYERYVQAPLDQHCGTCHGDTTTPAHRAFNSNLRPGHLGFKQPYAHLLGNPSWGSPYRGQNNTAGGFGWADTIMVESFGKTDPAAYSTYPAMTRLSYKSRLVKRFAGEKVYPGDKHPRVEVDRDSLLRVIHWVDAMGPYYGSEELRQMADPLFDGKSWISQPPRIHSAPLVQRPGPFDTFHPDEDPAYDPPAPSRHNALPHGITRPPAK
jgi:hypothetical protein